MSNLRPKLSLICSTTTCPWKPRSRFQVNSSVYRGKLAYINTTHTGVGMGGNGLPQRDHLMRGRA